MQRALIALVALGLAACSREYVVTGAMEDGDETFTGSATGYSDQSGVLRITSNKGRSCTGRFVLVTLREGRGTVSCTDGTSGPFEFVTTGRHGTGSGRLGTSRVTFTFDS